MIECSHLTVEATHISCVDSICFSKEVVILDNLHLQNYVWQKDCLAYICLFQLDKQVKNLCAIYLKI
jgi:hypothetical protein